MNRVREHLKSLDVGNNNVLHCSELEGYIKEHFRHKMRVPMIGTSHEYWRSKQNSDLV